MERKSFAIGIDLGTTNSRVCFWNNDRFEIIRNDQGNRATPSFVAFTEDERLVGEDAFHQVTVNATNTIFDSKRLIGRRFSDKAVQDDIKLWPFKVIAGNDDKPMIRVTLDNGETKEVSPEEISSMVLSQLKKMAEDHLGSEVKDAVITVPANYDQSQRQATINAGEIAGLNVLRLINEPTAAAIYYSYDNTFGIGEKRNVLICDLGGGKFDVSCLTITKDRIEVKAAGGDSHLGGQDFDTRLVNHFVEVFKRKHKKDISGNPRAMRRLRTACEKAKRSLSVFSQARIRVDDLYEGVEYFSERITQSEFEELNSDLFNKCIEGVEKCLMDAKMDKKDVDEIVLVGGSSRIPKIQQMLREFMNGKEIYKSINANEAIVNGAAIQAAILSGQRSPRFQNLALKDVTSLSLGIEIRGKFMYVFIPKNTVIPTRVVKEVTTAHDYQTSIKIPVYEGERARIKDNKFLGEMILTGIKPALRRVPEIDVCFSLQGDGILDVSARDRNTGKEISITIKDVRSSAEEVQRMIKEANEYRANDEMYKRKGVARYALEIYIVQVRNEMKSMHLQNDDKRKVDNAISMAVKLLDSRELAEVDEYENEKKRLMSVMDVVRRMEN